MADINNVLTLLQVVVDMPALSTVMGSTVNALKRPRAITYELNPIMQNQTTYQTVALHRKGESSSSIMETVRELSEGRVTSAWVETADLPEDISSVVTERGVLCITLPASWSGDTSRLGGGHHLVFNQLDTQRKQCRTWLGVGDMQIALCCWTLDFLDCIEVQLPVLFVRPEGWQLVIYHWDALNECYGLQAAMLATAGSYLWGGEYDDDPTGNDEAVEGAAADPLEVTAYRYDRALLDWAKVDIQAHQAEEARSRSEQQ